jgi:hypothetical protein
MTLFLGWHIEDRKDYIAAADHLNRIHRQNRACAQAEIAWMQACQLPKSQANANPPAWQPCP